MIMCINCPNFHRTSTITTTATNVILTFSDAPTGITNEQPFCFRVEQDIPAAGSSLAVQLTVNGAAIPLWDKFGNPVPGCGLKRGRVYKGYFGTGTADHVISASLPCGCVRASYACSIEET